MASFEDIKSSPVRLSPQMGLCSHIDRVLGLAAGDAAVQHKTDDAREAARKCVLRAR